jgi:DNA-binding Xre family transcriptional regulator
MRVKLSQYEEAIRKSGGFLTHAAKMLGVSVQAVHQRIKSSERLQKVYTETKEQYLDLAESKLIQKIKADDLGAICFFLKCQGKDRGYIERWQGEISGRDGGPIKVDPPTRIEVVLIEPKKNPEN